jgi:NTE family protein
MFTRKRKKIGIAFGGGAAKGLAHLGVLKVLQEESVDIDLAAGTSAGSFVGALFCAGYDWKEIRDMALKVKWTDLITPTFPKLGLVETEKLEGMLNGLLKSKDFESLSIPFRAVAVDIGRGEEVVLHSGSIARAVRASCSIPAIFEPTRLDNRLLVDGGLLNDVPADVVRNMGADLVIAIDLNANKLDLEEPDNIFDVLYQSLNILINYSRQKSRKAADFYVTPDVAEFGYQDLRHVEELIAKGEDAMRRHIESIKRKIR